MKLTRLMDTHDPAFWVLTFFLFLGAALWEIVVYWETLMEALP